MRNALFNTVMIKNFKHKGLKKFFEKGSLSGIQAKHADRLRDRLAFLDAAVFIEDMAKPGYNLHELIGNLKGRWSIVVSGNWRITFEFKDGDAYIVDYEDYH
ncbi:HigB toxin protein [methanotrophic endosymbiont of Bathymodiolus puteoserpentis (Logatchev)]|nr:HigB toxin protein [methanotrophic endosymbiont of Bathymodiolus puteoserpentis (Logatchev)]